MKVVQRVLSSLAVDKPLLRLVFTSDISIIITTYSSAVGYFMVDNSLCPWGGTMSLVGHEVPTALAYVVMQMIISLVKTRPYKQLMIHVGLVNFNTFFDSYMHVFVLFCSLFSLLFSFFVWLLLLLSQ